VLVSSLFANENSKICKYVLASSPETQPDQPTLGDLGRSDVRNNTSNAIEQDFGFDTIENLDEVITDDEIPNHTKVVLHERLESLKYLPRLTRQSTKITRIPHQVVEEGENLIKPLLASNITRRRQPMKILESAGKFSFVCCENVKKSVHQLFKI
jgi:hypothetical protein